MLFWLVLISVTQ